MAGELASLLERIKCIERSTLDTFVACLNSTLCSVTLGHSNYNYIQVQKLFAEIR